MSAENPRRQVRPGETCESCGKRPAELVMWRGGNLVMNERWQIVGEVDTRVAMCQPCMQAIVSCKQPLPPARMIARLNPETGKMEPL